MKNKQQSDNIIIEVDKKYASQFAEWLHLHNVHVIEVKIKLKSPSQVIIKNNKNGYLDDESKATINIMLKEGYFVLFSQHLFFLRLASSEIHLMSLFIPSFNIFYINNMLFLY